MPEETRPARPWSGLDFQIHKEVHRGYLVIIFKGLAWQTCKHKMHHEIGSHPVLSYVYIIQHSMIIIFFSLTVISIDKSGFVSLLPNFFLFTVSLIAGSRALSHLPILVCISVSNVVPASIYLLDNVSLKKSSVVQLISSFVVIATAVPILLCADHVIFTGRRMIKLVLNVCFDLFSRHKKQIWK